MGLRNIFAKDNFPGQKKNNCRNAENFNQRLGNRKEKSDRVKAEERCLLKGPRDFKLSYF